MASETADDTLAIHDPSSGKMIATVVDFSTADVDRAVASADAAFRDGRWRCIRPADRERIPLRFAGLVFARGEIFAQLETLE